MNLLRSICCLFGGSCPSEHREPTKELRGLSRPLLRLHLLSALLEGRHEQTGREGA
jgi:hypothetical protein